jgi:pyrroloquinoline quinone (PQQ) biosynthesis protein C
MQRIRPPEIAYVRRVLVGTLSHGDFVRTQVQFLFAIEPYADCLAMLAARCESLEARRVLEQNLLDAHDATFRALLDKLGVTAAQIDASPRWPCVDAFNDGVREACTSAPEMCGIATIAAIEDLFTNVSAELGRGIVVRGWLAREEVMHYNVHRELDRVHADALYAVLDAQGESAAHDIQRGLARGVALMVELYAGLLRGLAG